ncbi:Hypothetical_protein [Hexamita inflata]|uniref:Hypothetical_protein n=1 Tax=Hexamita inflata TaxID=28002 RepID=A0AA86RF51_9EUKA|nr:Hypothetical protein HINF_LOCUS64205 [Hexamita inflata]
MHNKTEFYRSMCLVKDIRNILVWLTKYIQFQELPHRYHTLHQCSVNSIFSSRIQMYSSRYFHQDIRIFIQYHPRNSPFLYSQDCNILLLYIRMILQKGNNKVLHYDHIKTLGRRLLNSLSCIEGVFIAEQLPSSSFSLISEQF